MDNESLLEWAEHEIKRAKEMLNGVSAIIDGFVRGYKAAREYDSEIHAIKALGVQTPALQWIDAVTMRSPLSHYEAYLIFTFLENDSKVFKRNPLIVTQFIVERACRGCTVDVILSFLRRMEKGNNK